MYLPSWHSANIWNVFLKIMEVGFLTYENRENLSFRQFLDYYSYSVIISYIMIYLAVKGLRLRIPSVSRDVKTKV